MMNYLLYLNIGEFSFQADKISEDKNNINLNNLKFLAKFHLVFVSHLNIYIRFFQSSGRFV